MDDVTTSCSNETRGKVFWRDFCGFNFFIFWSIEVVLIYSTLTLFKACISFGELESINVVSSKHEFDVSRWVSYNDILFLSFGEQGWRSGESARLPAMWPGFDSGFDSGWVEFAVGSRLAPRVVLWVIRFSSLLKNQHFKIPIPPGDRGPA